MVAKSILIICSNYLKKEYSDLKYSFFRNEFIPESAEALSVYNKWTETVKDCNWYKKTIKPGKRAGLIF